MQPGVAMTVTEIGLAVATGAGLSFDRLIPTFQLHDTKCH